MATGCLPGRLYSLESVQLGRFVLDPKNPHQEHLDPFGLIPDAPEFLHNFRNDFKEEWKYSETMKLRPYLSAFSISYERKNTGLGILRAPRATTYDLKNPREWFERACGEPETRKFLENENNNRRKVYLIVGIRTVFNGSLVKGTTWKKGQVVKGEAPMPQMAGVVAGAAATGLAVAQDAGEDQEIAFVGPGEQVFAIVFRKVKFKWLSRKTVDSASIGVKNRWTAWWEWRGLDDGEEDDNNVLEASLTDASDLETSDDEFSSEDDFSDDERDRSKEKFGRTVEKPHVIPTDTIKGPSLMDLDESSGEIQEIPEVQETAKVGVKPEKGRANSKAPIETNYAQVESLSTDSGYPQSHETPKTNTEPEPTTQSEPGFNPEASQASQPTAAAEPYAMQKPGGMSHSAKTDCVILFCLFVWVVVYYFPSSSFFSGLGSFNLS